MSPAENDLPHPKNLWRQQKDSSGLLHVSEVQNENYIIQNEPFGTTYRFNQLFAKI